MMSPATSLSVAGLSKAFGETPVLDGLDLEVPAGSLTAVLGPSGCGKTTLLRLLGGFERADAGSVRLGAKVLCDESTHLAPERREIGFVPQEGALFPHLDVAANVGFGLARAERRGGRVEELLSLVDLDGLGRRLPHQLSGGQQQRVTIAMACVCEPPVAVLDEPTTGLDVLTQDRILFELDRLRSEQGMAMVYVSHDLAVVSRMADRIVVMYAGRVVENARAAEVIERPRHPYTRALVAAIPDFRHPRSLRGIPGVSVGVGEWPRGCAFAARCDHAGEQCSEAVPALAEAAPGHVVRCCRTSALAPVARPADGLRAHAPAASERPLLEVTSLEARYRSGRAGRPAVAGVSFAIEPGRCVALVGESGSGKTTIGRCLAGLHTPSAGSIAFAGAALAGHAGARPLDVRRRIQIVFQNPFESLNPRHQVKRSIARPLRVLCGLSRRTADERVGQLLERVRLPKRIGDRFPVELSGGERQRVAIARALAAEPELLICDEVTSALDVSVQAAVLELLQELQRELGLSMLFITHNLGVVACVADSVLVMDKGELCESGQVAAVLEHPSHEYTRRLLAAAPTLA
jgi:peptide/nickel transport system ATP-binding protein